jgi:hypothetical protein
VYTTYPGERYRLLDELRLANWNIWRKTGIGLGCIEMHVTERRAPRTGLGPHWNHGRIVGIEY